MPVLCPPEVPLADGVVVVRGFGPRDLAGFEAAMAPGGNEGTWLILCGGARASLAAHISGWAGSAAAGPTLAVTQAADDALAGVVYLVVRGQGIVELAYGVAPPFRGQDIAARAARPTAAWLLGAGWPRVELRIADGAVISQRVAVRAGFRLAGRVSTWVPSAGRTFDDLLYVAGPLAPRDADGGVQADGGLRAVMGRLSPGAVDRGRRAWT